MACCRKIFFQQPFVKMLGITSGYLLKQPKLYNLSKYCVLVKKKNVFMLEVFQSIISE